MEHGVSECAKEQSDVEVTMKTEIEAVQSMEHVYIEIDVNHLKPAFAQHVQSEPASLVNERIQGGTRQDPKDYHCNKCMKTFQFKSSWQRHCQNMHGAECYICTKCSREFKCISYLRTHINSQHSNECQCDVCKKTFKNKRMVRRHILAIHGRKLPASDNQQGKESTSTPAIVGGEAAGSAYLSDGLTIKQELEDTDIDIGPTVLQHMDSQYGTNQTISAVPEEIAIVDDCNEAIPSSKINQESVEDKLRGFSSNGSTEQIQQHHLNHVPKPSNVHGEEKLECDICKKQCKSKIALWTHITYFHRNKFSDSAANHDGEEDKRRRYRCDQCLNTFKSKFILKIHSDRAYHTKSHKCTQCDKEFISKVNLLRHVQDAHSDEQYECDICKKQCKSKIALWTHLTYFHHNRFADPKDGNYRCDKCMKTFQFEIYLRAHCRNLHGTKCYKCAKCSREFKCISYLRIHMASNHSNERYNCDICNKTFKNKRTVRCHIIAIHGRKFLASGIANHYTRAKPYLAVASPDLQSISTSFDIMDSASDNQPGEESTSTPAIVGGEAAGSADLSDGLNIKQKLVDTDLKIGPAVLQHTESHDRTNQVKAEPLMVEYSPLRNEQIVEIEPDLSTGSCH